MTTATANTNLASLIKKAVDAARAGNTRQAHTLFGYVTENDPGNEAAWLWYAKTSSNNDTTIRALKTVLVLNPSNPFAKTALPKSLLKAGIDAAKEKDRDKADELLAESLNLEPSSETAWLWRAGIQTDPKRQLEFLERVLRINPSNSNAITGIQQLKAKLVQHWECPICSHQPKSEPEKTIDYCSSCHCAVNLENPGIFDNPHPSMDENFIQKKIRELKKTLQANPNGLTAYKIGLAYLNAGRVDDGIRALQFSMHAKSNTNEWKTSVSEFLDLYHGQSSKSMKTVKPKILVVDDSITVRKMVSALLTQHGYSVLEANDAEQAANVVRDFGAPSLFILDVNMPGIDGFGLAKMLRSNNETNKIPVMFLTGQTGLLNKLHGRWVGAVEYISKPFQPEKLLESVRKIVPIPTEQRRSSLSLATS